MHINPELINMNISAAAGIIKTFNHVNLGLNQYIVQSLTGTGAKETVSVPLITKFLCNLSVISHK